MLTRFALVAILGLAACKAAPVPAVSTEPANAAAPVAAWETIEPGGDTLCATGTPYRFHVRAGDPDKVMIFLNGGGACWSGDLCDLATEPTPYTPFSEMDANTPRLMGGAFDAANPANPFAGWTQVFVPYCTGDAHLGAKDVTYTTSAGGEVVIHHRGKANVQSALDWVYAHHTAPASVFVGGGSAGAIASPYYAGIVAEHYPQADITQNADGAGGYRAAMVAQIFEIWGVFEGTPDWPELAAIDRSTATMEDLFRVTAARYPRVQLSQFNTVDDGVQQQFLALMGVTTPVRDLMRANLADLSAGIPGFRAYSAAGADHTLLRYDRLYTTGIGGVAATDWYRDLVSGLEIASLSCETEGCE